MRQPASLASSLEQRKLPMGLMQRLEIMQQLALQARTEADRLPRAATALRRRPPKRRAQLIVLAWFSLGTLASGTAGFGTLMGLQALEARGTPLTWASVRSSLGASLASAWAKMPVASKAQPGPDDSRWERVEVTIDPSQPNAPLGLQVTGGDGTPVFFVLDGLPEGVRPSHGAVVGPGTWVVGSADIGALRLTLDAGAPTAFDVRIALLEPTGVAKTGSVVAVRPVDATTPVAVASTARKAK